MDYRSAFIEALKNEDKDKCVELTLLALDKEEFSIPYLYEKILKPCLYELDECKDDGCIWKEHIRTSIIRTVIESIYPYVIRQKKGVTKLNREIVLACPEKEYHEIGLRMVDDIFSLNGYHTTFIGTNTPRKQVLNYIKHRSPHYLALSVTDFYLLFEAQKMIGDIKSHSPSIKVIVGGNAFKGNSHLVAEIGADVYIEVFQDIEDLRKGDLNEIGI